MTNLGLSRWASGVIAIVLGGAVSGAAGCGSSADAPAPPATATAAPLKAGRVVEIAATTTGFSPATVEAKPGETLTLRFTRTTPTGCMSTVTLPGLGIQRELPMNQPVDVTVTAPADGAIPFECGMAMLHGRIVVGSGTVAPGSTAATAPPSAKPHADHSPRHDGIVTMEGDLHVEVVVAADGAVDLYVSDSVRQPISPAEVTGTLEIDRGKAGKQVLPLIADPGRGSLSLRAAPPEQGVEYTWDLKTRGQKTKMTLAVPAGGTARLTGSTGSEAAPDAGSSPPEIRRAFGKGQVALSLDASGRATLRLLDAGGAPVSARDVTATIRVSGKETPFSYDDALDGMRAGVGPVKGDHADALVTITAPGGKPTPVRVSFHLESTAKKQ